MDMTLVIRTTGRFVCFLCALASLTQLTLGCSQDFLDVIGPGVRVKRGPHWKWGNQDGNGLGTVTTEISSTSWITVKWDNGHSNSYRAGHQNKCDLALVNVLETECNFFPTNITNTGDFLLSYQDFPRPVHARYRCHKHIQSPDETKVVALHILMNDICNTTIYSGSNRTSGEIGSGCNIVSGTYVSSGRDMYIETFKELGTKYGFMAYVTYEQQECALSSPVYTAQKDVPGYINSPYSRFTLGSRINCTWEIRAESDQLLEITVTFLDDEPQLDIQEDGADSTWVRLKREENMAYYTSKSSVVTLRYEKDQISKTKGFQLIYKAKDRPTKAFCREMVKTLEPGEKGLLTLPAYDPKSTGSLECKWHLSTNSKLASIQLTATRSGSVDCGGNSDVFTINGDTFPSFGGCEKHPISVTAKEIALSYTASSSNNSIIVLEYEAIRHPFCFDGHSISVDEKKAFLAVPAHYSFQLKKQCWWTLVSPENQLVSVEVISQIESGWEPHNAFLINDGKNWNSMTENKIISKGNKLLLKYDISKQPTDFSGEVIVTYTAVSPTPPTTTMTPTTPRTPRTPRTPAAPIIQSSTVSSQPVVECSQSGVPIWCYIVIALLCIACLALFITSYTLYRRQIYVCDEHGSLLNLRLQDIIAKDDHL